MNPPDPIPAPVKMSEARARKVLLTIARLQGGTVQRLVDFASRLNSGSDAGLAYMGNAVLPDWWADATWTWRRSDSRFGWIAPRDCGVQVISTGRIDRGLGAAK